MNAFRIANKATNEHAATTGFDFVNKNLITSDIKNYFDVYITKGRKRENKYKLVYSKKLDFCSKNWLFEKEPKIDFISSINKKKERKHMKPTNLEPRRSKRERTHTKAFLDWSVAQKK